MSDTRKHVPSNDIIYYEIYNDIKYNVCQRAKILSSNGFGFKPPDVDIGNVFVIAIWKNNYPAVWEDDIDYDENIQCNQYLDLLPEIRIRSNCDSVDMSIRLDHRYLFIHWQDYSKIYNVINACISLKMVFRLMIPKAKPWVDGNQINTLFTRDMLEELIIKDFPTKKRYIQRYIHIYDIYFDEWNWMSMKGKQFCSEICKLYNRTSKPTQNYYTWPIFQNVDMYTLKDL